MVIVRKDKERTFTIDMVSAILRFQRIHRHDYTLRVEDTEGNVNFILIDMQDRRLKRIMYKELMLNSSSIDTFLEELLADHKRMTIDRVIIDGFRKLAEIDKKFPLVARGQHKTEIKEKPIKVKGQVTLRFANIENTEKMEDK